MFSWNGITVMTIGMCTLREFYMKYPTGYITRSGTEILEFNSELFCTAQIITNKYIQTFIPVR